MSPLLSRRSAPALLYAVSATLCSGCMSWQRIDVAPMPAVAVASGDVSDIKPVRVVRVAMRNGTAMTLQDARMLLRNDTLQAVLTTSASGAPMRAIAVPFADIADIRTRKLSVDRSIGAFLLMTGTFAWLLSLLGPTPG